jgi:hypothetical protein
MGFHVLPPVVVLRVVGGEGFRGDAAQLKIIWHCLTFALMRDKSYYLEVRQIQYIVKISPVCDH